MRLILALKFYNFAVLSRSQFWLSISGLNYLNYFSKTLQIFSPVDQQYADSFLNKQGSEPPQTILISLVYLVRTWYLTVSVYVEASPDKSNIYPLLRISKSLPRTSDHSYHFYIPKMSPIRQNSPIQEYILLSNNIKLLTSFPNLSIFPKQSRWAVTDTAPTSDCRFSDPGSGNYCVNVEKS